MPINTKVAIAAPSGFIMVLAFILFIMGIVIMTSGIPQSKCGKDGAHSISSADQDEINNIMFFVTLPLLVGGILAGFGGALGICGGLKSHICGVGGAAGLLGTSAGFLMVGSLFANGMAAMFSEMCDEYKCDSTDTCGSMLGGTTTCGYPDTCCKGCSVMCKESVEWACDIVGKKQGAMVLGFISFVVILIASILACSASCCCPSKFTGMAPAVPAVGVSVVGTVIGQPVAQNNEECKA